MLTWPRLPLGTSDDSGQNLRAILLMILAMLIIPGSDAFAKLLSETISAGEIVFFRFLMQSLLLLPIVLARRQLLATLAFAPGIQLARGVALTAATVFFFSALKYMPLAESISIFFVEPLILTLLSAVLLGEAIRARRITAIIIGFIGALIIIRPSFSLFGWASLLPLCAATCFAFYMVLTRHISRKIDAWQMQFSTGVMALTVAGCALIFGFSTGVEALIPSVPHFVTAPLIIGLGISATLSHVLLTMALRQAGANALAPFQYCEIIGATVLGYLVFSDLPDKQTILGVAVIIASGLYLLHRESSIKPVQDARVE